MPPKYTITDCIQAAESHPEGRCIDTVYSGSIAWYCGIHDYTWSAQPTDVIKKNKWCKECANERMKEKFKKPDALQECIDVAINHGGQCLSPEYVNAKTELKWKCSNKDHMSWHARPDDVVRRGTWCRECNLVKAREIKLSRSK